jgi:hypothetical protein
MQLIGKGWLVFSLLLACALLLLLGWYGYRVFSTPGRSEGWEAKYQAEHFLHLSLLGTLLILLAGAAVVFRARRLFRDLDMLAEFTRQGQFPGPEYLRRLGPLGPKIETIYSQLAELNEAKSLKIGTLSNLNKFLAENIDLDLAIMDIRGQVIQGSKRLLARLQLDQSSLGGRAAADLIEGLNFDEVRAEMARTRRPVVKKGLILLPTREPGETILFFPVANPRGELANIVAVIGKEGMAGEMPVPGEQLQAMEPAEPYLERLRHKLGW